MRFLTSLALLILPTVALAQQPDTAMLQSALQALQAQRNRAMDEAASAEAQLAKAQQQIADMQKQLDELKSKDKK